MTNEPLSPNEVHRELTILVLVGLLLVVVSLFLASRYNLEQDPWLRGLQEFGISLLEAGLIIGLLDLRSAREQVKRTERMVEIATRAGTDQIRRAIENLFDSIYLKPVPESIRELYIESAFRSPLFRLGHKCTYTFQDRPAPPGMIWISCYQRFAMKNLTKTEQIYDLEVSIPRQSRGLYCVSRSKRLGRGR